MLVALSNCSEIGFERQSNRSRIVVVTTVLAVISDDGRFSGHNVRLTATVGERLMTCCGGYRGHLHGNRDVMT